MASAIARAYRAPSGVQGQSSWSPLLGRGQSSPEAEALLVSGRSMEVANFPTFLKFGNVKESYICVIFAKDHGWPQNWGACAPWPRPKTATYYGISTFIAIPESRD